MNRKFLAAAIGIGGFIVYLTGCSKASEDKLAGAGTCDTTNISYSKQIVDILQNNCYSCHTGAASSSGIDLTSYAHLQAQVVNGNLVNAVSHTGNVTPMPYGLPQLPSCEVNTIAAWVHQGALNN